MRERESFEEEAGRQSAIAHTLAVCVIPGDGRTHTQKHLPAAAHILCAFVFLVSECLSAVLERGCLGKKVCIVDERRRAEQQASHCVGGGASWECVCRCRANCRDRDVHVGSRVWVWHAQ